MSTHVATLELDLHFPLAQSLKAKRAYLRPITERLRSRFGVAVAEVAHQDHWQRAGIAVAAVGAAPSHLEAVLDACERFVWSNPELEVVRCDRRWLGDA